MFSCSLSFIFFSHVFFFSSIPFSQDKKKKDRSRRENKKGLASALTELEALGAGGGRCAGAVAGASAADLVSVAKKQGGLGVRG